MLVINRFVDYISKLTKYCKCTSVRDSNKLKANDNDQALRFAAIL